MTAPDTPSSSASERAPAAARTPDRRRWIPAVLALAGLSLLGGAAGGWFAARAMPAADRPAVEAIVRSYILDHPDILPQAMANLRRNEGRDKLAGVRTAVETPFAGAVLGNPRGKVTLVEFSDFACGFCRQSVADVDALIAADPELRVVMRELPILSPESADAARWALAAAEQGRYAAFHKAMFAAGRPSAATIAQAAATARLDMARARATIASPRVEAELQRNVGFARQLGFEGTPSWVVGDQILGGALGRKALGDAIAAARGR